MRLPFEPSGGVWVLVRFHKVTESPYYVVRGPGRTVVETSKPSGKEVLRFRSWDEAACFALAAELKDNVWRPVRRPNEILTLRANGTARKTSKPKPRREDHDASDD